MPVTRHPPHRSVRALLTHTALILDVGGKPLPGIWLRYRRRRQKSVDQNPGSLPRPAPSLAAATEGKMPTPCNLLAEGREPRQVPRHPVVVEIPAHYLA